MLFFLILRPQYSKYAIYVDVSLYDTAVAGSHLYRLARVGHPPLFADMEDGSRVVDGELFPIVLLRLATTDGQLFAACGAGDV